MNLEVKLCPSRSRLVRGGFAGTGTPITAGWGGVVAADLSFLAGSNGTGIATSDTTTNTGYADLASTLGPLVSLHTGGSAIVMLTSLLGTNTTGQAAYMS